MKNLLKVRLIAQEKVIQEQLTRLGIGVPSEGRMIQSCHLVRIQGEHYICHFLELRKLVGDSAEMRITDIQRRNQIVALLEQWELIEVLTDDPYCYDGKTIPLEPVKIFKIKHKDRTRWTFEVCISMKRLFEAGVIENAG